MIRDVLQTLTQLAPSDRSFTLLALLSFALFGLAILGAALTLLLRVVTAVRELRNEQRISVWEPLLLAVLAGERGTESFSNVVAPRERLHFLRFLNGYADRVKGQDRETLLQMARPHLSAISAKMAHRSARVRGEVIDLLIKMGANDYAPLAISALDDDSDTVAMIATRGLFRERHEIAFERVLDHLPRFTAWSRSLLTNTFTRGGPAAAPVLRTLLVDRARPPLVRAIVADTLRQLHDLPSVELAAELLELEEDRELLISCLRLMTSMGHRHHLDRIRELSGSPDDAVRAAATEALGTLGEEQDVMRLRSLLGDASYWVSLRAGRGLRDLGYSDLLRQLAGGSQAEALLAREVLAE